MRTFWLKGHRISWWKVRNSGRLAQGTGRLRRVSLARGDRYVAAVAALGHVDLSGNALAEFGDVADDAHDPAARPQAVEDVHPLVEGLLVQGAESLVDEERLHRGAGRLGGDHVGQAEREGEAGQERLAAGGGGGGPVNAGPEGTGAQG